MRNVYITEDRIHLSIPWQENGFHLVESRNLRNVIHTANFCKSTKTYSMPLSRENVGKLWKLYSNQLAITSGREHIDALKQRWREHEALIPFITEIKQGLHPVEVTDTNFVPRKHQPTGISMIAHLPYTALFCSCGTGKTFMALAAANYLMKQDPAYKGKILVVAPLTVIYNTWLMDGTLMFPKIKYKSLWMESCTKRVASGLPRILNDYGSKPKGTVKLKRKEQVVLVNSKDNIYNPKIHTNALPFNKKKLIRVSYAVLPDGSEVKVGKETLLSYHVENPKTQLIQSYLQEPYDVFIINHEGLQNFEEILTDHKFKLLLIDESTRIKSRTSHEFKSLEKISVHAEKRVIMSGTPAPNGPEDLWSQFKFLDGGLTLQPNFTDFQSEYFHKFKFGLITNRANPNCGDYHHIEWKLKSDTTDRINERVAPFIYRVKLRDCTDLPPLTRVVKSVTLSDEQLTAYEELDELLRTEVKDAELEVTNSLTKILRLAEITGGFATTDDGVKEFSKNPKLDTLEEIVEGIGDEQMIIFAQRTWEIDQIKRKFSAEFIDGRVDTETRQDTLVRFKAGKFPLLVCQPKATAHGLNLQFCHYVTFYSIDHNMDIMMQALARIERMGQTMPMFAYYLIGRLKSDVSSIDELTYDSLQAKDNVQQQLIDRRIVKSWLEKK